MQLNMAHHINGDKTAQHETNCSEHGALGKTRNTANAMPAGATRTIACPNADQEASQ